MNTIATALPLAFQMPGFMEMMLIAGVGLLIFGKRLPEVGKSLGKGIVEFKKGLKGIEDEVDVASSRPSYPQQSFSQQPYPEPDRQQIAPPTAAPAYKFDPYTGKPIEQSVSHNPPTA